jgi:invasin B
MSTAHIEALRMNADVLSNSVVHEGAGRVVQGSVLREAAKVLQEIVPVLVSVTNKRLLFDAANRITDPLRPVLVEPNPVFLSDVGSRSGGGGTIRSTLLLASMVEILDQGSWNRLAFNANAAVQRDAARTAERVQLIKNYDVAQGKVADALSLLALAAKTLSGLAVENSEMERQLQEVDQVLVRLADGEPGHDVATTRRNMLCKKIRQGKSAFLQAQMQVEILQGNVVSLQEVVNGLMQLFDRLGVNMPSQIAEKHIGNMERMLMLMTQLGDMMLKIAEVRVETQRSIVKLQEDIRLNKLVEDAEKADRDMAKAEALNKALGYTGKILGGVVMAAALIGAVFTGGASLVLAGIGLGLMLADSIYQEATGNSFMAEAMKPIINLIQPLVESLMNVVSGLLERCGMDSTTARTIGLIIVVVVLAVGTVALTLASMGSAVARLASSVFDKLGAMLSKICEKTIARITSEAVRQGTVKLSRQISISIHRAFESVARLVGLSMENAYRVQIVGQHILRMSMVGSAVHTVAVGGFSVAEKNAEVDAEIAVASMRFTSTELSLLQSMFSSLLAQSRNSVSAAMNVFEFNSKAITDFSNAGKAVAIAISNTRAL